MEVFEIYGTLNLLFDKEENVLNYRPGGYHPVALGDTLSDGRYKICHKLGYGGFSTVWVARDSQYGFLLYDSISILLTAKKVPSNGSQ